MNNNMRYCLALDLVNEEEKIAAYEAYHKEVWPEIIDSIKLSGIQSMEIYRVENRLFMIMETDASFSFEAKSLADTNNPKVQEWEKLMWNYQQALPSSKLGEKWRLMDKIFCV
jgi:L-rhamnose mutarotase